MQQRLPLPEIESPTGSLYPPPRTRQVYCNRNLRLDQIELVGFDMDYTLAVYKQSQMDRLSIEATVAKLVDKGYPEALLSMEYRIDFPIRGLLVDRRLGNVLKMDRYRYVKRAYHGLTELSREDRRRAYHTRRVRPSTPRYHWVDTLYALSEVAVYSAAVEHLESLGQKVDYDQLFADVRQAADQSHQDGSILDFVLADLPTYVERDPQLGATFHKFRSAGKKLFLLTNSGPDYTDKMMSYLMNDALPEYPSWRHYFDYTVAYASKPRFFTGREPFVHIEDGQQTKKIERGKLYTGGNMRDLQKSVGVSGDAILYIGDHIYGDVVRAKKNSAWRTAMILQEMDDELDIYERLSEELARGDALDAQRTSVQDELREHQSHLKRVERKLAKLEGGQPAAALDATRMRHRRAIDRLRTQLKRTDQERRSLKAEISKQFHPFWGPLFKTGVEVSSFGDQVEQYACLYTSRVSNFYLYSPMHYFESPRDRMPHER